MGIESTDLVKNKKQHTTKPIAVGLVVGVGLALALNSWLLGIMFGIIFYVALKEADKKENSSSEEV
jgi:hypothetical protein